MFEIMFEIMMSDPANNETFVHEICLEDFGRSEVGQVPYLNPDRLVVTDKVTEYSKQYCSTPIIAFSKESDCQQTALHLAATYYFAGMCQGCEGTDYIVGIRWQCMTGLSS